MFSVPSLLLLHFQCLSRIQLSDLLSDERDEEKKREKGRMITR